MFSTLLAITVAVIALAAAVRRLEPRFAFFPSAGESTTPAEYHIDYESLSIPTRDGERLHGWLIRHPRPLAHVVYFHGNGGNLSVWAPILAEIARHGYSILAFDYRGYGLSTGRPTEHGLYVDVAAIVERFRTESPAGTPAVYWGRSLGTTMAAYAATIHGPDGLILESGFPSARSLLRESPLLLALAVFSTYRFPCARFVQSLDTPIPVLVMHGDSDRIVPIAQGRALFEALREPKQFLVIRGGDHNDVTPPDSAPYWKAIETFVAGL